MSEVEAIFAALAEAGYVIVPREPTGAMVGAGTTEHFPASGGFGRPVDETILEIWRAMIDAYEKIGA